MPNDISTVNSGNAFFEFQLNIPGQRPVTINSSLVVFEQATVTESVHEAGTSVISLITNNTDYVDRALKALESNGSPVIRFRYGIGAPGNITWIPWQLHLLLDFRARPQGTGPGTGHALRLTTGDMLTLINRPTRVTAFRGTISQIVRNIAQRNGIQEMVVDDTAGDGLWIQSYMGDVDFIRKRLIARARSTRGRGNYFFFARDNVLHFHPVDFQTEVKDLNYYASPFSSIVEFDLSQRKLEAGASGVSVVSHDPYTGLSKEIVSVPDQAIRLGNSIPLLSNVIGADRNELYHLSINRPEEAKNIGQNAYESARSECFQLKMELAKTQPLRSGDVLRINLDPNSAHTSTWSGAYLVVSASHHIKDGSIQSVYVLQRGEQNVAKGVSNALADLGVATIQDQQNAPGFALNVTEAQASNLTRGAGKSLSGNVYLTTQDANSAPTPPPTTSFIPQ